MSELGVKLNNHCPHGQRSSFTFRSIDRSSPLPNNVSRTRVSTLSRSTRTIQPAPVDPTAVTRARRTWPIERNVNTDGWWNELTGFGGSLSGQAKPVTRNGTGTGNSGRCSRRGRHFALDRLEHDRGGGNGNVRIPYYVWPVLAPPPPMGRAESADRGRSRATPRPSKPPPLPFALPPARPNRGPLDTAK